MKNRRIYRALAILLILSLTVTVLAGCGRVPEEPPYYADSTHWASFETDATDKAADVFFVTPTVYSGGEDDYYWSEYDENTMGKFVGAMNMERHIYDANARFFAPIYHQCSLSSLYLDEAERMVYSDIAYKEIREAFLYYMEEINGGRPLILAGFSQGGEMLMRLMKEFADDKILSDVLVACYAIGWRLTEEEIADYPAVKMAQGEDDIGVLITFNTVSDNAYGYPIVMPDTKVLGINPLNWTTDATPATLFYQQDTITIVQDTVSHLLLCNVDCERYYLPGTEPWYEHGCLHHWDILFYNDALHKNILKRVRK